MTNRLYQILTLVDNFVPGEIREHELLENHFRARVMLIVPFIVGFSNLFTCIMIYRSSEQLEAYPWLFWVALLSSAVLLAVGPIFRRTVSFEWCANIYGLGATLTICCLLLATGGIGDSPFVIMLPFVVFFTFIMASIQTALVWGGINLGLWWLGTVYGPIESPNVIPADMVQQVKIYTVINAGIVMMGILWFFDLFHRHLLRRLQVERDRALFSAARDPLTGLANRKTFEKYLKQLIEDHHCSGRLHALLLMDLDEFKLINDTHGHASGDLLLKTVASGLKNCVRNSDLAARLGGDEFGLLLSDVRREEDLIPILVKIREVVTRTVTLPSGAEVAVGASIGAALIPTDGDDPEHLLHHADKAMYRAKNTEHGYVFVGELPADEKT